MRGEGRDKKREGVGERGGVRRDERYMVKSNFTEHLPFATQH